MVQSIAINLISTATALGLIIAPETGHIRYSPKPLLFLGAKSYSVYLTHNPITGASFFPTKKVGLSQWLALVITVISCIAVAWAFWWLNRTSEDGARHDNKNAPPSDEATCRGRPGVQWFKGFTSAQRNCSSERRDAIKS